MPRSTALRLLYAFTVGGVLGATWLLSDGLLGPGASFGLIPLLATRRGCAARFTAATGYYACGSVPIVAAVVGYWGAGHAALGIAAWIAASLLLAAPWSLAAQYGSALGALALTALPPLGFIGWLSPLNCAGVLFPGTSWVGLCFLCVAIVVVYEWTHEYRQPHVVALAAVGLIALMSNLIYREAAPPNGWTGINTHLKPGRGNVLADIQNNQQAIRAGIAQAQGARIVVFPEAILDDWWPGTREQLSLAVPSGQLWILGAATDASDAVVAAAHGQVSDRPLTRSAGLIFGGNWLPWSRQTLQPAWWEPVFSVEDHRVWAALCVEQLQPWTWFEAMLQRADVVLALSNGWWADTPGATGLPAGGAALAIEHASSRAWSRLMHSPLVWAVNQ